MFKIIDETDYGVFTSDNNGSYFIETPKGNFVWKDPDHGGDNKIFNFDGDILKWLKEMNIPFGRNKGHRRIEDFCGEYVQFPLN